MKNKKTEKKCLDELKIKCPKCGKRLLRIIGIIRSGEQIQIECSSDLNGCMFSEYVKDYDKEEDIEFSYIPPKKKKDIEEEGSYKLPPMPKKKDKKSNLKKR